MTRLLAQNAVSFIGLKYLNTVHISSTYGVMRVRAAVVIAAIMAVLGCNWALAEYYDWVLRELNDSKTRKGHGGWSVLGPT